MTVGRSAVAACVLAAVSVIGRPSVGRAQEVEFRGGGAGLPIADQAIRRVLDRGRYRVIVRDTVLAAGDTIAGDLIVLGATLRIEGAVRGDVIAVQSDVFARPGGRIGGTAVAVAGGFYGSSLARLSSPPIEGGWLDYRVRRRNGDRYVIVAPESEPRVDLPGLYGLLMPAYDRVNALTVVWGLDLRQGRPRAWPPGVEARLLLRSERTTADGTLKLSWPFKRHSIGLEGGRTVRSNDRWVMGDLANSVSSFVLAADYRNYYEALFLRGDLVLSHGTAVRWTHRLAVGVEDASSLENGDPFSIFAHRHDFQPNLPIDEGTAASLTLGTRLRGWSGRSSRLVGGLELEVADSDLAGELTFTVWRAELDARIATVGASRLVIRARGQIPGSSRAPRQRWRGLGGWRTLPTLDRTARAGDHMWWVGATYEIPTGRRVDLVGRLVPWVGYAAGNAWDGRAARPGTVHNVGGGLALGRLTAGVYTAPSHDFDVAIVVGIAPAR